MQVRRQTGDSYEKRIITQQRRWNFLHSHRWTSSGNGRCPLWILLQVARRSYQGEGTRIVLFVIDRRSFYLLANKLNSCSIFFQIPLSDAMKAKARLTIGGGRDFDNGRVSQHPSSFVHAYNTKTIHTRSVETVEARRKKRLIEKFHERNTFSLYERNTTSAPTKIFSLSVSSLFRLITLKRLVTEDETLTEESYFLHARVYMHIYICIY